jgi:hypothetical protein
MNWKASLTGAVIVLIAGAAVGVAIGGKTKTKTRLIAGTTVTKTVRTTVTSPSGGSGTGGPNTTPTTTPTGPPLGPVLSPTQLGPVLPSQSAYQSFFPNAFLSEDTTAYALQGGISMLGLCNGSFPAPGLKSGPSNAFGTDSGDYLAGDTASFTGQGAAQFMSTVRTEAPSCNWQSLTGTKLDDDVLRLSADQKGPSGDVLHDEVILVRDKSCVVEIAIATSNGSYSLYADKLARGAAKRLALAVNGA